MNKTDLSQFVKLCASAGKENCLDELLRFFFTLDEQEQMSKRITLVQALLTEQQSQREISKDLAISISKITRGSTMLKQATPEMKKFLTDNLLAH
jgi:TrpR family trp operon transcriptional repressor